MKRIYLLLTGLVLVTGIGATTASANDDGNSPPPVAVESPAVCVDGVSTTLPFELGYPQTTIPTDNGTATYPAWSYLVQNTSIVDAIVGYGGVVRAGAHKTFGPGLYVFEPDENFFVFQDHTVSWGACSGSALKPEDPRMDTFCSSTPVPRAGEQDGRFVARQEPADFSDLVGTESIYVEGHGLMCDISEVHNFGEDPASYKPVPGVLADSVGTPWLLADAGDGKRGGKGAKHVLYMKVK